MRLTSVCVKQVGNHVGAAGHVMLTYPSGNLSVIRSQSQSLVIAVTVLCGSGGHLMASCGHWKDLSKLHVTEKNILRVRHS